LLDQFAKGVDVQRLGNEIERAQLERTHGCLDVAVRRDYGNWCVRLVILDPLDQRQAVAVGELHVRKAQIKVSTTQLTCTRSNGFGHDHIEVHTLERDL
jgi:hypothetical protein